MTMSYDELLIILNELLNWECVWASKDSFKVMLVLEKGDRTTCKRKHYTFGLRSHTFDAMWLHIENDLARWANWDKHVST